MTAVGSGSKKAFDAMVNGNGGAERFVDPVQGIKDSYNKGVTDEFIMPFVCTDNKGEPLATIRDDDSCICFNFRADRVREITRALCRDSGVTADAGRDLPDAEGLDAVIPRTRVPNNLKYVCMTQYDRQVHAAVRCPAGIARQHSRQRYGQRAYAQLARG